MRPMLVARSIDEALLYLDLNFCSCGTAPAGLRSWRESRDGLLVSIHDGTCSSCGSSGRFEFELDASETVVPPAIGDDRASQIIDPGEFLWLSDSAASKVPANASTLSDEEVRVAELLMEQAIATLEEVLKFIPAGKSEVPEEAVTSRRGISLRRTSPRRFHRDDIGERLESYRQGLLSLQDA